MCNRIQRDNPITEDVDEEVMSQQEVWKDLWENNVYLYCNTVSFSVKKRTEDVLPISFAINEFF